MSVFDDGDVKHLKSHRKIKKGVKKMFRKRIISSLLVAVMMLALLPMTSVFAATDVTWKLISNDQIMSNVTDNLNLVTELDDGTVVTWTSSKPQCVTTDGVVTRWENDETVTLKATYGSSSDTFNIVVTACDSQKASFTDNKLNSTLKYQNIKWTTASSDSGDKYTAMSPMVWRYDAENDKLYTETQYGSWGYNYGLKIDGTSYKWDDITAVKADTSLKNTTFTYNDTSYTFYYVDKAFVDADENPYRVGVCAKNDTSLIGNWVSFYVNIDEETGAVSVDTTKALGVALEGYIKQNLEPVVLDTTQTNNVKYRSHLNFVGNGWSYSDLIGKTDGYQRFSFRYRQVAASDKMRWEPYFSFFYNNKAIGINCNGGPGSVSGNRYYGSELTAYYKDDFSATFTIGNVSSSTANALVGSANEALAIKTSTDGLSAFPKLTGGSFWNWLEIIMETDRANRYTVMYANGQPVYWKGTVGDVTYYSPYMVHTNATSTSADPVRTGFACPLGEKLFVDFEVDSVKIEEFTAEEIAAARVGATVTTVADNDATVNFARKGAYAVVFADFDATTGAFVDAEYVPVTVTATGEQTITATKTAEWDKVFVWSAPGSIVPVIGSVDVADFAVTDTPAAE